MKRYYIAAATLLLGTSALAWAPSDMTAEAEAEETVAVAAMDGAKAAKSHEPLAAKAESDVKFASASWDEARPPETLWADEQPELVQASAVSWEDVDPEAANPDLDLSETSIEPPVESEAAFDDSIPVESEVALDDSEPAIGDPLETEAAPLMTADAADLTPRPAAGNYPPCDPGPGDDNCIQLYEPGVRTALASWTQPTGGLMDGSVQTAMGGPYEPADDEAAMETAMNGDGMVDEEMGELEDELTGV